MFCVKAYLAELQEIQSNIVESVMSRHSKPDGRENFTFLELYVTALT